MINLIPNKEKKEMVKGFYYRLAILFFVMIGASFLIILVAILPSYLLSLEKDRAMNAKLEMQKNEPVINPDQQTLAIIKDLNKKLSLIENSEKNKFIISERVINAIILQKTPNIKITSISYENDPLKGKKVSIQGTASSREVLLSFRQALENSATFKQVDLPISNFVKGSNIEFYLNLIPS